MTRVAIIGNAGGGKSTLARLLGQKHGLPVHEVEIIRSPREWKMLLEN